VVQAVERFQGGEWAKIVWNGYGPLSTRNEGGLL
jgi:hypothetical protein